MILYKCLPKMKHVKNMGFSEFRRESADSLFFHARLPQSDNFDLFAGLCLMICFLVALGKASGSYLYLCYLQTILVATTWTSLIVIDFVELSGIYSKDSSIPFHSIPFGFPSILISSLLPFPLCLSQLSLPLRSGSLRSKTAMMAHLPKDGPHLLWVWIVCVCVCLFVCQFVPLFKFCLPTVSLNVCVPVCLHAYVPACLPARLFWAGTNQNVVVTAVGICLRFVRRDMPVLQIVLN